MAEITKDVLEKEIESLTTQRAALLANINAIDGAIMECRNLIAKIETPTETPKDPE